MGGPSGSAGHQVTACNAVHPMNVTAGKRKRDAKVSAVTGHDQTHNLTCGIVGGGGGERSWGLASNIVYSASPDEGCVSDMAGPRPEMRRRSIFGPAYQQGRRDAKEDVSGTRSAARSL